MRLLTAVVAALLTLTVYAESLRTAQARLALQRLDSRLLSLESKACESLTAIRRYDDDHHTYPSMHAELLQLSSAIKRKAIYAALLASKLDQQDREIQRQLLPKLALLNKRLLKLIAQTKSLHQGLRQKQRADELKYLANFEFAKANYYHYDLRSQLLKQLRPFYAHQLLQTILADYGPDPLLQQSLLENQAYQWQAISLAEPSQKIDYVQYVHAGRDCVYAVEDATVLYSHYVPGNGYQLALRYANSTMLVGMLRNSLVESGQQVIAGSCVAHVGEYYQVSLLMDQ